MKKIISIVKKSTFGLLVILAGGCTSSGSDAFSQILDNGSGGTGNSSITISTFSPVTTSPVIKDTGSQQFIVSAVGQGPISYVWTVNNQTVNTTESSYTFNASAFSVGTYTVKVSVSDLYGTLSQSWSLKVNGSPSLSSSSPSSTEAAVRRGTAISFSTSFADPNSDTLTYVWRVNGQEGVINSTSNTATWTPNTSQLGTQTVSVTAYDGGASDSGTYSVTRSWSVVVNNFSQSCNDMDNQSLSNKTCVYTGIPGIGDGVNPDTNPTDVIFRPTMTIPLSNGDFFIADDANDVVWYWNKSSSTNKTILGISVPASRIKVIAGVGVGSSGNSVSVKATRYLLSDPQGILWDGVSLYISEVSNNRVIKVDSTGTVSTILNSSCTNPRQMTIIGSTMYVACYGSNTIRSVDLTNLTAATFAGTGTAGNPTTNLDSTFTDATNGVLNGPFGIVSDSLGNLIVSEYLGCRLRYYNLSATTPTTLYGSFIVAANRTRTIAGIAGSASCGTYTPGEAVDLTGNANGALRNLRSMSFDSSGYLYIGQDGNHSVIALNFTSGTPTVFGTALPAYGYARIAGDGNAGYLNEGGLASTARFNNPLHAVVQPTTSNLIISDYGNNRLRWVRNSDSRNELLAGIGSTRSGNVGQGNVDAENEKLSNPRGMAIDTVTGEIFIADMNNNRIRSISKYGVVSQAAGTGVAGSAIEENDSPSNTTMNNPRGLVLTHKTSTFGGHLVWADVNNHKIRLWNRSTSDATLFGVFAQAGKVVTIGGSLSSGNLVSGPAVASAFNSPSGVAFDGTNLYVADTSNHCIKKISSTGDLSAFAGTCGTSGNVNGIVGTGRLSSPQGITYYENGTHTGLLIADQGNARVKFHRFSGTALLFGSSISIDNTVSVACGGSTHSEGVSAVSASCNGVFDVTQLGTDFCFTNYGYHNIRCVNTTGIISTVFGSVQGNVNNTTIYFPGASLSSGEFDSASPSPTNQNGVSSFYYPTTEAEPEINECFGKTSFPISVRASGNSTLYVVEYLSSLIRKVRKP